MPFRSEKQRRFMHARHPEIAARWEHKYGSNPRPLERTAEKHRGRRRRKG